jgi:hypothetical protein
VEASVGDSRIVDEDQYPELNRSESRIRTPELHISKRWIRIFMEVKVNPDPHEVKGGSVASWKKLIRIRMEVRSQHW